MAKEAKGNSEMKLSESSVREQMSQHENSLTEVEKVIAQAQQVLNQNVEQRGMLRGAIQSLKILLGEDPQVGDQAQAPPAEASSASA